MAGSHCLFGVLYPHRVYVHKICRMPDKDDREIGKMNCPCCGSEDADSRRHDNCSACGWAQTSPIEDKFDPEFADQMIGFKWCGYDQGEMRSMRDFAISKGWGPKKPPAKKCGCGLTWGTIHRFDGPCEVVEKPTPPPVCEKCGVKYPSKLHLDNCCEKPAECVCGETFGPKHPMAQECTKPAEQGKLCGWADSKGFHHNDPCTCVRLEGSVSATPPLPKEVEVFIKEFIRAHVMSHPYHDEEGKAKINKELHELCDLVREAEWQ